MPFLTLNLHLSKEKLKIKKKCWKYVVTAAFYRPKTCSYGVGCRHHGLSLPQMLSLCGPAAVISIW